MTFAEDAAGLVHERQRATEAVAEDREQRRHAASLEDGLGEALVHLKRLRLLLQLLAREPAEGRLRDRDERRLVRDGDDREPELVRRLDQRRRHLGEPEADA